MSDKSWLCSICGHHIRQDDEGQLLPEGGRAHTYCIKSKQFGIEDERERIIKLLENHEHIWRERVAYEALIALIKGEQK